MKVAVDEQLTEGQEGALLELIEASLRIEKVPSRENIQALVKALMHLRIETQNKAAAKTIRQPSVIPGSPVSSWGDRLGLMKGRRK